MYYDVVFGTETLGTGEMPSAWGTLVAAVISDGIQYLMLMSEMRSGPMILTPMFIFNTVGLGPRTHTLGCGMRHTPALQTCSI